jgi:protein involved in polysaccharide export with SLBB domain
MREETGQPHGGRDTVGRSPTGGLMDGDRFRNTLGVVLGLGLAVVAMAACARHTSDVPAPPPAALLPTAPHQAGVTYRIQSGDQLHVRFPFQADVSEDVPVRPDGRISLATTGEIDAVGMTPIELGEKIKDISSKKLRNPEVVVVVTKVAERFVYVGGEVNKPGFVTLQPEMTPLQAVIQVGGFRHTAKLDSVLLLTPGPDGRFSAARMDMQQVVENGVPERVRLHPGDVVYAPTTWIADMDIVVDQYVRGLIPALPRVGVGYSLSQ